MNSLAASTVTSPMDPQLVASWHRGQHDAAGIPADPEHWLTQLAYELDGDSWTTGIESDARQRGSAINIACTSSDDALGLAIIQVREAIFRPGRYTRVRKDYYLIGRDDRGLPFAHPLTNIVTARHSVRQALAKIWECRPDDLDDIIRQGDIALVPTRRNSDELQPAGDIITLAGTHIVRGEILRDGDTYYAAGRVSVKHTRGQHPGVYTRKGLWRLQVANRGSVWGHTTPTAD